VVRVTGCAALTKFERRTSKVKRPMSNNDAASLYPFLFPQAAGYKFQIPSTKSQINSKSQYSMTETDQSNKLQLVFVGTKGPS
jgi:hypothetical protein